MADGKVTLSTALDNKGLEKGIKNVSGVFGGLAKTVTKTATVITAAFAAAAIAITKQAVDAYAEYEQLVGGIETLFKNSASKVQAYAEDAFYTAGVSANEYMATVTSFSASLISALAGDTEKAADVANMAMIDMSDNANKMGTDMSMVQSAYQGFAKQNYTMLDNLKLGYGGTKTEMERLLKDAEKLTGVKYDISNLADVYSAIHAIQEELGVAGATAKEAEKTITGAANMTKAAWKNVLSAIAGGGDLDKAINNMVYSISKYFENIVPVVERSLAGIGQLIEKIAPQLVQTVATALIKALPSLLNAVYQMIVGLAKGIYQGIVALFTGGDMAGELTAQLNDIASSADAAADAEYNLAEGIEAAEKAAEKSLAGFDELNVLQSNSVAGTSASTSGGMPSSGGGISAASPNYDSVDSVDTSWLGIFNSQLDAARVSIQNLALALEPVKAFIAQGLVDFYNLVLVPIGTWVLGEGFPRFVDAISNQLGLIDWEALNGSLVNLWDSLAPFAENIGEGLLWFWEEVITPLIGWAADSFIPSALNLISEAIDFLDSIIEGAEPALQWIWDNFFVPIGDFAWQAIIDFLDLLTDAFSALSDWASENQGTVSLIATTILGFLAGLWVYNTAKNIVSFFSRLSAKFLEFAATGLAGATSAGLFALGFAVLLAGIIAVSAAWGKMSGAQRVVTILGALAAAAIAAAIAIAVFHSSWTVGIAAAAIAGGIALLVGAFSALGTTDFSKILSGSSSVDASSIDPKKFGVGTGNFSLPALAQGAVLPANKPFLAMVGDQKHGTNIEAPLTTIQEAVAIVMEDMIQSNIAGYEAIIAVLREILEAVLGIEIGDDTIAHAVARYNAKMAVVRGG